MNTAVIVTYNRQSLLERVIGKISKQTQKPDNIVVVDNCSQDETQQMMNQFTDGEFLTEIDFESDIISQIRTGILSGITLYYLRLNENGGGSLGFHIGCKFSHEVLKSSTTWLMDDDGYPDEGCLEALLYADKDFASSLVLSIEDHAKLAFGINGIKDVSGLPDGEEIFGAANPFNSILLKRKVFQIAGYPRRDFFIYGDENEYQQRLFKFDFIPSLIKNSIHFHPEDRQKNIIVFKFLKIKSIEGELRTYCYHRNTFYTLRKYFVYNSFFWALKVIFSYLILGRFRDSFIIMKSFIESFKKNFSGHKKYLK